MIRHPALLRALLAVTPAHVVAAALATLAALIALTLLAVAQAAPAEPYGTLRLVRSSPTRAWFWLDEGPGMAATTEEACADPWRLLPHLELHGGAPAIASCVENGGGGAILVLRVDGPCRLVVWRGEPLERRPCLFFPLVRNPPPPPAPAGGEVPPARRARE